MSFEWILLIVLLALSGFFSASEIAFLRGNKIKIELWARNNNLLALYSFANCISIRVSF